MELRALILSLKMLSRSRFVARYILKLLLSVHISSFKCVFSAASFIVFGKFVSCVGADLGRGCRGHALPSPEMKPSSYWLLKFVYHTSQPFFSDPPLLCIMILYSL